jgi:hypothetical protein
VKTFILIGIFRSNDEKSELESEGDDFKGLNKWKGDINVKLLIFSFNGL